MKNSKTIIVTTYRATKTVSSQAIKERVALTAKREMDNTRFETKSSIMKTLEATLRRCAAEARY